MSHVRSALGAATLLGVVCAFSACNRGDANGERDAADHESRPTAVVVVEPEFRSLSDVFLDREATIFPASQPQVASRQDGVVKRYVTEVGDILHEGDLIAELDDTDHRLALAEHRAALTGARATLAEEKRRWKRAQKLFSQNVIAQGELDDRLSALERARAQVLEATARVERAETDLADLRIVAPIPGVVTTQDSFAGEYVERGDRVAEMKRVDLVFAVCTVNERSIASIQEGAPAWVEVTSLPDRRFEALVWKVVPDVDLASRSVLVKLLLPNPGLILKPGMSGRVSFVRELDRALLVPKDAVLGEEEERYVLVVEDGVAERRPVDLGAPIEGRYHVRSGLTGGERVIVAGNEDLDPGSSVQVVQLPPPGPPTLPSAAPTPPEPAVPDARAEGERPAGS